MNITREEYEKLKRDRPHLFSESNSENKGVCATKQKQPKGDTLERVTQRKDKSGPRFEISFRIYSRRPNDWDNPWTKAMQDCLIQAGLLHGDEWNVLQGRVQSEKAHSQEEERTEIEISQL